MQQMSGSNYEYLQVFRIGSGTRQSTARYVPTKASRGGCKKELDFSKVLDREMNIPALALR